MTAATALQGMGLGSVDPGTVSLFVGQPKTKLTLDETGWTLVTVYLAVLSNWVAPGLYSNSALNTNVLLVKAEAEQLVDAGELCFVTLTYNQRYVNTPSTPTPQAQYGISGSADLVSITLHPNFVSSSPGPGWAAGPNAWDANAPWEQFWDATKKDWLSTSAGTYLSSVPVYLKGWTKYPAAGCTVWTKVYFDSQPGDPPPTGSIIDPGYGFGPSGSYVLQTCDQAKENAFWCRTSHFQYFPTGAPTQIYKNG
jgi:hypothetical protein